MQETNSTSPQIAASVNSSAEDHRNPPSPLIRKRRFASYSYLQTQALWRIELVFVAQGDEDNNIFTPERLYTIHQVERLLMQHAQFQQFCWKPLEALRDLPLGPSFCSPPSSLLSYLFPSERAGKIYYDGMGPDLADVQGELSGAIYNVKTVFCGIVLVFCVQKCPIYKKAGKTRNFTGTVILQIISVRNFQFIYWIFLQCTNKVSTLIFMNLLIPIM